jgi:phosphomannomutase
VLQSDAHREERERKVVLMAGIFKAYDIRGIVGKDLDEELAYKVGRAFVRVTKTAGKSVLIGRDMRTTSEPLAAAAIRGMTDEGADVVDANLTSAPLFYFATKSYPAGIMVTASHNPKEYNGFKLCREQAIPISYDTGIDKIEKLVREGRFDPPAKKKGKVTRKEYLKAFLDFNLKFLKITKPVKIVVDAGNGMGGYEYSALTERFAQEKRSLIEIVPLYFELDGEFPNHEANPLKEETLTTLRDTVRKTRGAALGLALDGDGDRCVFLDEKGEVITADLSTALIARELLKAHKGATIMYDLRSSRVVPETIAAAGGKPFMYRVGHAYIKAKMREEKMLLGGELSGHFYPGEANYTENTMYALFQVLNLLEETGKRLSELVAPLRKYSHSGEINSEVKDPDGVLRRAEAKFGKLPGVKELSYIDGLRVEYPTWWFNLRKSNTEPVIRLNLEAETREEMERRRDELIALIRA